MTVVPCLGGRNRTNLQKENVFSAMYSISFVSLGFVILIFGNNSSFFNLSLIFVILVLELSDKVFLTSDGSIISLDSNDFMQKNRNRWRNDIRVMYCHPVNCLNRIHFMHVRNRYIEIVIYFCWPPQVVTLELLLSF